MSNEFRDYCFLGTTNNPSKHKGGEAQIFLKWLPVRVLKVVLRCPWPVCPPRSPNLLGRRKQLTRCRIKHELTVGPLKENTLFHCGSVLQRILGLLNIKYCVSLCSAIKGTGMWCGVVNAKILIISKSFINHCKQASDLDCRIISE